MSDVKAKKFVDAVILRTMGGRLSWEKTPSTGEFQSTVGNYIVKFRSDGDFDRHDEGFTIRLIDANGEIVDTYSDESFNDRMGKDDAIKFYKAMQAAYERARQIAMGVDKALDEVLRELDPEMPF